MKWSRYLYKSYDDGENWEKTIAFPQPSQVTQLYHSQTKRDTLYASTSTGLYVSKNAGKEWQKILDKYTINIVTPKNKPETIYASCKNEGVFKSSDDGDNWIPVNDGLKFLTFSKHFNNRYSVLTLSPDENNLYVLNSTWGRTGGVYRSSASDIEWKLITDEMPESWLKTSRRMNDIAISTTNRKLLFLGSSRYIYASTDGGDSWAQKISRKVDDGWTHTGVNVFGQTRAIEVDAEDRNTLYAGTADHKILRSRNAGKSWRLLLEDEKDANYVWDISTCPVGRKTLNIITSGNSKNICFMKSSDKGESWSKNCSFHDKASWKEKILVAPDNCNHLLLSTYHNLYASSDGGDNWQLIAPLRDDIQVRAMENARDKGKSTFIGTSSGMYLYNRASKQWKFFDSTAHLHITSIYVHPDNPDEIYIGTQLSRKRLAEVYKSVDGGRHWQKLAGKLRRYVSAITSLPANPDILYFATLDDNYHDISKGSGIYRSINRGSSWQRIDRTLPVFRAYDITTSPLYPYSVFLASNGSGVYRKNEKDIAGAQSNQIPE